MANNDSISRTRLVDILRGCEAFAPTVDGAKVIEFTDLYNIIANAPPENSEHTFTGADLPGPLQLYAVNNLRALTPGNMQEFDEFITKHGVSPELMRYAIDVACGAGANRWNYVASVLYNWLDDGVKTVGDAKAKQAERRKRTLKAAVLTNDYTQRDYKPEDFTDDFYYDPTRDFGGD